MVIFWLPGVSAGSAATEAMAMSWSATLDVVVPAIGVVVAAGAGAAAEGGNAASADGHHHSTAASAASQVLSISPIRILLGTLMELNPALGVISNGRPINSRFNYSTMCITIAIIWQVALVRAQVTQSRATSSVHVP